MNHGNVASWMVIQSIPPGSSLVVLTQVANVYDSD